MKIEAGKTYKTANGDIVTVRKNALPYYKFSAHVVNGERVLHNGILFTETWTEDGVAYHHDCGHSFVEEICQ